MDGPMRKLRTQCLARCCECFQSRIDRMSLFLLRPRQFAISFTNLFPVSAMSKNKMNKNPIYTNANNSAGKVFDNNRNASNDYCLRNSNQNQKRFSVLLLFRNKICFYFGFCKRKNMGQMCYICVCAILIIRTRDQSRFCSLCLRHTESRSTETNTIPNKLEPTDSRGKSINGRWWWCNELVGNPSECFIKIQIQNL